MTELAELAKALTAAQAEMSNATLNKVNPHYKSKYADLTAIREATLPALNKHGLAIAQYTDVTDGQMVLVTRLMHTSGAYLEGRYLLPGDEKPQAIGSALTYARRYSWSSITGITADEDDDGQAAQASKTKKSSVQRSVQKESQKTEQKATEPDLGLLRKQWFEAGQEIGLSNADLLAYLEVKYEAKATTAALTEAQLNDDIKVFQGLKEMGAEKVQSFKQGLKKKADA